MSRSLSVYNYCFTFHHLGAFSDGPDGVNLRYLALEGLVSSGKAKFVVGACEVAPGTGSLHMQGFVILTRKTRKNTVIQILKDLIAPFGTVPPGMAIEPFVEACRGTALENYNYCVGLVAKKGNLLNPHRVEYGEVPQFRNNGERERSRYASVLALAREGNLDRVAQEHPDIYLRMFSTLSRLVADATQCTKVLDNTTGILLCGSPGTGKSLFARRLYPNAYIKTLNKWWDGMDDPCRETILDDLDPSIVTMLADKLKHWCDRYWFRGELKGSSKMLRPSRVVLTTQYQPVELFQDRQVLAAMFRRCRCFRLERFANGEVRFFVDRRSGLPTAEALFDSGDAPTMDWSLCSDEDFRFFTQEPTWSVDSNPVTYDIPGFLGDVLSERQRLSSVEHPPDVPSPCHSTGTLPLPSSPFSADPLSFEYPHFDDMLGLDLSFDLDAE